MLVSLPGERTAPALRWGLSFVILATPCYIDTISGSQAVMGWGTGSPGLLSDRWWQMGGQMAVKPLHGIDSPIRKGREKQWLTF